MRGRFGIRVDDRQLAASARGQVKPITLRDSDPERVVTLGHRLVGHYRGDFLTTEKEALWAQAPRDRNRSQVTSVLCELVAWLVVRASDA